MGLWNSIKKGRRLTQLQRKISPPGEKPSPTGFDHHTVLAAFDQSSAPAERLVALEEYLDFCMGHETVRPVIDAHTISKLDMRNFARMIRREMPHFMDGWIKGHYVPLSSLAYPEPLAFLAITSRLEGWTSQAIVLTLASYWQDEIPQSGLGLLIQEFPDGHPSI